jgi:hypothetical protein
MMIKSFFKKVLILFGLNPQRILEDLDKWSVLAALKENKYTDMFVRLRQIIPDISSQEESEKARFSEYSEIKRRGLQTFQCFLMLEALNKLPTGKLTVADIGDSAGTHMLYLKELARNRFDIDTISVNLDPRAIEKIKARGLKAILCRAEDLDLGKQQIDLFTSFEMVEHLHNPAIFFRRLAKKSACSRMVVTVPYLKNSRVGLHHIRNRTEKVIFAEDEHIFELSPEDWTLLLIHSGWKVVYSKIYYQYPRKLPVISRILQALWRKRDYEGFWGAILEKDTRQSDFYLDWEE